MKLVHGISLDRAREYLRSAPQVLAEKIASNKPLTPPEYGQLLAWQCQTLQKLTKDQDFAKAIEFICANQDDDRAQEEIHLLLRDSEKFAEYLRAEEAVLLEAGAGKTFTAVVIARQKLDMERRKALIAKQGTPRLSAEEMMASFQQMCDAICAVHRDVDSHIVHIQKMRESEKEELRWLAISTRVANTILGPLTIGKSVVSLLFSELWAKQAADLDKHK